MYCFLHFSSSSTKLNSASNSTSLEDEYQSFTDDSASDLDDEEHDEMENDKLGYCEEIRKRKRYIPSCKSPSTTELNTFMKEVKKDEKTEQESGKKSRDKRYFKEFIF